MSVTAAESPPEVQVHETLAAEQHLQAFVAFDEPLERITP
jgi:hypothetical protein